MDTFFALFSTKQELEYFCKQHHHSLDSLQQLLKQVFAQIDFFNFGTITWEQFYQTYANCKKLFPSWDTFEEPIVRCWPKSLHFHDTWYVKELNRLFAFDQESLSLYSLQNLQLNSEKPFLQFKSFVTDLIYWPTKQFFIMTGIKMVLLKMRLKQIPLP